MFGQRFYLTFSHVSKDGSRRTVSDEMGDWAKPDQFLSSWKDEQRFSRVSQCRVSEGGSGGDTVFQLGVALLGVWDKPPLLGQAAQANSAARAGPGTLWE